MIATAALVGVLLALLFAWLSLASRSPHRKTRRQYDAPLDMDALDRLYREADAEEYDLPAARGRRRNAR